MIIDLSGKSAVVSASTAGIGLAIATGIAAAGADTVVNGRKQEAVDRAIGAILKNLPRQSYVVLPATSARARAATRWRKPCRKRTSS